MILIRRTILLILLCFAGYFFYLTKRPRPLPVNHGKVNAQLFLAEQEQQKLLVLLGGSEGGNLFALPTMSDFRQELLDAGYALLCVEYFGGQDTPSVIDRIELDSIMYTIMEYQQHPLIINDEIYLYGVSRGSEAAMHLAIKYPQINAVLLAAPSAITLASRYGRKETSSWMISGEEIPFAKANPDVLQNFRNNELYEGMLKFMQDSSVLRDSSIPLWKAKAHVLCITPDNDSSWPSLMMGKYLMTELEKRDYRYQYRQVVVNGGHEEAVGQTDIIVEFLQEL